MNGNRIQIPIVRWKRLDVWVVWNSNGIDQQSLSFGQVSDQHSHLHWSRESARSCDFNCKQTARAATDTTATMATNDTLLHWILPIGNRHFVHTSMATLKRAQPFLFLHMLQASGLVVLTTSLPNRSSDCRSIWMRVAFCIPSPKMTHSFPSYNMVTSEWI